jgi:D-tyrosyl-tRNA(Tyr) deacylase
MRVVLQRVTSAKVEVENKIVGTIDEGLLILLGVEQGDTDTDLKSLLDKTVGLRIFEDDAGKMNLCVSDIGGSALVVSQFTLLADCRKGRRPGFTNAAPPADADHYYQAFVAGLQARGLNVATGIFQADMQVTLVNNGPVTILLDSRKRF